MKINIIRKIIIFVFFTAGYLVFYFLPTGAQVEDNLFYRLNLDQETIKKGYTVNAFDKKFKISLTPGVLSEPTAVEIIMLKEKLSLPWQLDLVSEFYQFEFKNKRAYSAKKPFYIQIAYDNTDNNLKQVFFYDKNKDIWRPLPTKDFPKEKFVRTASHLPYSRLAVFSYPGILVSGQASWYSHKAGNFAASPDFPRGTRLRVYNTNNNKFVDVVVNDFGPDRRQHKNRVIDMEKIAFAKIAPLAGGVADIFIEPLDIKPDASGRILGIDKEGASSRFEAKAKSALVLSEDEQKVIFAKNADLILPLASLTKLVAVKVFLDIYPSSLDEIIVYSRKDEEYNYQYCQPGESARLRITEGETLTVKDLIYSSLIGSANNTVETLVRISNLSRDEFINRMNEAVRQWGASSTKFVEPTGLSPDNLSSAADYAIITKEVFKNDFLRTVSVTPEYIFYTNNTNKRHRIVNTNAFVRANKYAVTGSKTGYLHEAGYCLMTRIKAENGQNIIIIILGAKSKEESVLETEKLIQYSLRKPI